MDDIELLKKYYFEKEKENMRLKEELNTFKNKITKTESNATSQRPDYNTQPLTSENLEEDNDFFKEQLLNYASNYQKTDVNSQKMSTQKVTNNKTERVMDLGRVYKEGENNKIKSKTMGKNENFGQLAVKNLENHIGDLKNQISQNFEKDYEKMNTLNKLIYPNNDEKLLKYELRIEDLEIKLKNKEDEKNQLKEMYEKELKIKAEIYNQNIAHLNKTNQEEFRKLRIDYEGKMDELVKKSEEEKFNLNSKISNFEKEMLSLQSKNVINDKNELIDFQKKYLFEMKELQKVFEDFKINTYNQLKTLRAEKEDAINNLNVFKESYNKLMYDCEQNELKNKELIKKLRKKYEQAKLTIKNNEYLKSKLDETKNEVSYLKLQITKLENSERRLHNLLMENEKLNGNEKGDFIRKLNENYGMESNIDFKLSNSNEIITIVFSPINSENYKSNAEKIKINLEDIKNNQKAVK